MYPKRRGQFNISGAAGAGDEDQVVVVFALGEDLVHIRTQHLRADDGQVDARQERDSARHFGGGV